MTIEDMQGKDFRSRSPEERHKLAVLGGSQCTPAKSLAGRLRGLRWAKGENKSKLMTKLVDLITNPEFSSYELLRYAEELKLMPLTADQKLKLLNALSLVHKVIHGDTYKIALLHMNNDMPLDASTALIDAYKRRREAEESKQEDEKEKENTINAEFEESK